MSKKIQFLSNIIQKMSIDQKIGACLTLGFCGTVPRPHIFDQILKYHCGGLRCTPEARQFGSYVDPKDGNVIVEIKNHNGYKKGVKPPSITSKGYKDLLIKLNNIAISRPGAVPLHYSFDQEGEMGANYNFDGAKIFPMPMGLRATNDPNLVYEVALTIARQCRAVGFTWIHSPVLDINLKPMNPEIYIRSYSDRVEDVVEYSIATCKGLKEGGLIATAKHFPGRGDSETDAHFDMPVIETDFDTLYNRDLLPYRELIKLDLLPSIMTAHGLYPSVDPDNVSTVSKKVVTGLLRDKLGFDGVITTDSMTMGGLAKRYGVANACALALQAGADLILMKAENELVEMTFKTIKSFVEEKKITEQDLDDKVYRILKAKYDIGLFGSDVVSNVDPDSFKSDPKVIELTERVARQSIVIPKNDKCLPLSKTEKVLVIEQVLAGSQNNHHWHPGMLYESCYECNPNVEYCEVGFTIDEDDKKRIQSFIDSFNTIVVTNFYCRNNVGNKQLVQDLLALKNKKIILVTNTPYPLSIPENANNIVITFGVTPESLRTTGKVLFGECSAEGVWPTAYAL